jgi:MoxR-like ATPase
VRRLADAQARAGDGDKAPLNDHDYIEPGPLWWAFNRDSALRRGHGSGAAAAGPAPKAAAEPRADINAQRDPQRVVVLIDEIDKADPDVPNALLVPLGSLRFSVGELGIEIRRLAPKGGALPREQKSNGLLVVITTNEERELPAAFIRRCITVRLEQPDKPALLRIARMHFGADGKALSATRQKIAETLADRFFDLRKKAHAMGQRVPGTAEYLDALRACYTLDIDPQSADATWQVLQHVTLAKEQPAQQ